MTPQEKRERGRACMAAKRARDREGAAHFGLYATGQGEVICLDKQKRGWRITQVLAILEHGPTTRRLLATTLGISSKYASHLLWMLSMAGQIERRGWTKWYLKNEVSHGETA